MKMLHYNNSAVCPMLASPITDKSFRLSALIALGLLLLFSQLAAAEHGLDHHQHEHEQLCDAFLAFETNSANLSPPTLIFAPLSAKRKWAHTSPTTLVETLHSNLIRGPPSH